MDESEMHDLLEMYAEDPVMKIMNLITEYANKHYLAKECGSEYISQNDQAQIDALYLVQDIFDLYVKEEEEEL